VRRLKQWAAQGDRCQSPPTRIRWRISTVFRGRTRNESVVRNNSAAHPRAMGWAQLRFCTCS
jgi:hypothetical protein